MLLGNRYRVVGEIGIGGMGRVHLACVDGPGGFQKWVAIKRIHRHLLGDEAVVRMFLNEGRIAAGISHPNVATVIELGTADGDYFMAMEYLHGESLRHIASRAEERGIAMPLNIACRIIADAAEGLHAAHELTGANGESLGLVHRDVTPHNLFVTYEGVTKVVDFGIAKIRSMAATTGIMELKGKLAYMSPEQAAGASLDRRADVFALGVVAWELTTGQRLFRGETDLETLARVRDCEVPRPSSFIDGYSIELEQIIMKALSRDPSQRYATARQLARAIQLMLMSRGALVTRGDVASFLQGLVPDRIEQRDSYLRALCDPAAESAPPRSMVTTVTNPTRADDNAATRPMDTVPAPHGWQAASRRCPYAYIA